MQTRFYHDFSIGPRFYDLAANGTRLADIFSQLRDGDWIRTSAGVILRVSENRGIGLVQEDALPRDIRLTNNGR